MRYWQYAISPVNYPIFSPYSKENKKLSHSLISRIPCKHYRHNSLFGMLQTERIGSNDGRADHANGSIIHKSKKMGDPVKFGQFLIQILLFLAGMAGMWMTLSQKVETQRVEIDYLKNADKDKGLLIKDLYQQQSQQFNEINQKLTDIRIMLEAKANKK